MNLDDAVIARINKEGKHFEILVDCDGAMKFKKGYESDLKDAIYVEQVFTDAKKGTKASESDMENLFGTSEFLAVAEQIVKKGQVAVTTEYLRQERELKRRQIINLIATNSMNPKTNAPHPPQRIETALDEAKVKIDERKGAEEQIKEIISKINAILPITYGTLKLEVKIPAQHAPKSYGTLRQYAKVLTENWQQDGSLKVVVEIPSEMIEKFESSLNALTKGESETKKI